MVYYRLDALLDAQKMALKLRRNKFYDGKILCLIEFDSVNILHFTESLHHN